jgi:hypothetical protein
MERRVRGGADTRRGGALFCLSLLCRALLPDDAPPRPTSARTELEGRPIAPTVGDNVQTTNSEAAAARLQRLDAVVWAPDLPQRATGSNTGGSTWAVDRTSRR